MSLYADDTQIAAHSSTDDVKHAIDRLQLCVADVHRWCQSRRLQLNPSKTEAIWFGTKASLKKIAPADLRFEIGSDIIKPASSVRDLGVILENEEPRQQSCQYRFLSTTTSEAGQTHSRSASHCKPHLFIRADQT